MLYNTKWAESQAKAAPSLTYPSMAGYVHVLRHPELWPKDFRWRRGVNSATDLALELWPNSAGPRERNGDLTQMLAMGISYNGDNYVAYRIFFARDNTNMPPTADQVADRMQAFMDKETNTAAFHKLMSLRIGC